MRTVSWQSFLLVLLAGFAQAGWAQAISFTFDDGLDPRTQPKAAEWTQRLLAALASNGVQAMLFPAGKNIDSAQGLQEVRAWAESGHDMATIQRAQYYDDLARRILGRSPPHVMLLHANRINAEFIGDAIQMFRTKGWKVVAPSEAFRDLLYGARVQTMPAGESILWALAKESGMPGLRYPAEDGQYEKPILDAADE